MQAHYAVAGLLLGPSGPLPGSLGSAEKGSRGTSEAVTTVPCEETTGLLRSSPLSAGKGTSGALPVPPSSPSAGEDKQTVTWTSVVRMLTHSEANWAYSGCSVDVLVDFCATAGQP